MIPIALPLSCWACIDVGCTRSALISCGCKLLELALLRGCRSPPLDGEVGNLLLVPRSALTSPCGCANTLSNLLFSPCPSSRSGCRRKSSDAPSVSLLLLLLALVAFLLWMWLPFVHDYCRLRPPLNSSGQVVLAVSHCERLLLLFPT
jgi:hypothetical protein